MERICQYCKNIPGCKYLSDANDRFSEGNIVTAKSMRDCKGFEEVGTREKEGVRQRLFAMSGLGYLRALFELPEIVMNDLRQGEKDELMYEDIPDFKGPLLLRRGMLRSEREDVLRHETDDKGRVIQDTDSTGHTIKRPRSTLVLRHYATDENSPILLSKSRAWFWTTNQLLTHILDKEYDEGLILADKKLVTAKTVATTTPALQVKDSTMAAGRVVKVTQSAPAQSARVTPKTAAPAATTEVKRGPGRPPKAAGAPAAAPASAPAAVRKPVMGVPNRGPGRPAGVTPKTVAAPAAAQETAPAATAAGFDMDLFKEMLETAVSERLEPVTAALAALSEQLDAARQQSLDGITSLHDVMVKAELLKYVLTDEEGNIVEDEAGNPSVQAFPELGQNDDRILAYSLGTAFGETSNGNGADHGAEAGE